MLLEVLLPGQIDVAIEGQAMTCDQVAVVNAHSADLVVAHPDSGVWRPDRAQAEPV